MLRSLCAALIAAAIVIPMAEAQPRGGPVIAAPGPDLVAIPSRITHGAVSVRNAGSVASPWIIVTVNCHKQGQTGGCPELTPAQLAPYNDPDFPNRLAVNTGPIQPDHTDYHTLSFWSGVNFPAGTYVFEFVVDATNGAAEVNATNTGESNNTSSYVWVKP